MEKNILFFSKNLKYLRKRKGDSQKDIAAVLGVGLSTISNYEQDVSLPDFNTLGMLIKYFSVTADEMIFKNIEENGNIPRELNLNPVVNAGNDAGSISKSEKLLPDLQEATVKYEVNESLVKIPVVDTYAGASVQGYLTQGYIDEKDSISVPAKWLKKGRKYACFPCKGESMHPTLVDGDIILAFLLDKTEYPSIKNDCIYAVISTERDMVIKRVRNTLKSHGYLICRPDNKYYPTININIEEITQVFEVAARLTFHFPDEPKSLAGIEDRLDHIEFKLQKLQS